MKARLTPARPVANSIRVRSHSRNHHNSNHYSKYHLKNTRRAYASVARSSATRYPPNIKVFVFGSGKDGQLGLVSKINPSHNNQYHPTELESLASLDISHIGVGHMHVVAASNKTQNIFGWGHNAFFQLGRSNTDLESDGNDICFEPVKLTEAQSTFYRDNTASSHNSREIHKIVASGVCTTILTDDGKIWNVGTSKRGQLGHGQDITLLTSLTPLSSLAHHHIVDITSGWGHALALSKSGEIFSWGWAENGTLGHGDEVQLFSPKQIASFSDTKVIKILSGSDHSVAITESGEVYSFGKNDCGQLGLGDTKLRNLPTKIGHLQGEKIIDGACGEKHTLLINDKGQLFAFGWNIEGQIGVGTKSSSVTEPTRVIGLEDEPVVKVAAGRAHCLALLKEDKVASWGSGIRGRLGLGDSEVQTEPVLIPPDSFGKCKMLDVICGYDFSIVVAAK